MSDIQRWELVELCVQPPVDQLVIAEMLDRLLVELGDRWQYRQAAQMTVGDQGELAPEGQPDDLADLIETDLRGC